MSNSQQSPVSHRRLAFGTLAMGAGNFFKICVQLVMLPLMARLLGPSEYGLYSLAMPIITFIMTLADGGLGASLSRESEANVEVWSSAFWALLLSGFAMAGAVIGSSFLLAAAAHQPRLPAIMTALSPCLILFVLSVPPGARLARRARLEIGPIGDVIGSLAGAGCAILLALHHAGAWSLVAQTTVIYVVRCLVMNIAAPMMPRLHFSYSELTTHLVMGGTIIGGKLVDSGDKSAENALMGRNFGASELGIYSIANQIPNFLSGAVSNALWAAMYTRALHDNEEKILKYYTQSTRIGALILFPMTALIMAQGGKIIAITLGAKWENVSPMLEVFMLLSTSNAITTMGQSILYARGKPGAMFRITMQSAFLRVVIVAAAPWITMNGMIAGLAATTIFISFLSTASVCKEIKVSISTILSPLLWPFLSAIISGIICWQIGKYLNRDLLPLLLNLTACAAIFVFSLFVLDRNRFMTDFRNAISLLRSQDTSALSPT